MLDYSIILPVKNEREHIAIAVGSIYTAMLGYNFEIIVIYDSNKENSLPILRRIKSHISPLRIQKNHYNGLAGAIRTGVMVSRGRHIITLSADDSAPAMALPMINKLLKQKYVFLSGTRYVKGGHRVGGSIIGNILSRTANKMYSFLSGSSFTDLTTGFKVFDKDIFLELAPTSKIGGGIFLEMAIKAEKRKYKIGEFPFTSIDRLYGGKSSFSVFKWIKEYLQIIFKHGF